jgi:hypothetical protein
MASQILLVPSPFSTCFSTCGGCKNSITLWFSVTV